MARRYSWRTKALPWSEPCRQTRLSIVVRLKVRAGDGPFTLTQDGDSISGPLSRSDVITRFMQAITNREVGPVFRIRNGSGNIVFNARAVAVNLIQVTDSTNGNSHSDFYYNWMVNNYPNFSPRYAGCYVCKAIVGSSTLSQHSYGNAVDFFFDTMEHQDKVAAEAVAVHDLLHLQRLISRDRIWVKGQGWQHYDGVYHWHIHADFDPSYTGPCGVKP